MRKLIFASLFVGVSLLCTTAHGVAKSPIKSQAFITTTPPGAQGNRRDGWSNPAQINQPLRRELLRMERVDQELRQRVTALPATRQQKFYEERIAPVDARFTARLQELIKRHGWMTRVLVGQDGANAAFLIVQHSPSLEFQKQMLPFIREAFERGEIEGQEFALLADRTLRREGKKQLYGTQTDEAENGTFVAQPIEDEQNVDARRASIGLMPLGCYLKFLEQVTRQARRARN